MQMRVYAQRLDNDDTTWLAARARGSDAQVRIAAIAALGDIEDGITPTVEWALVSGLFDPAEDVAIRAVGELEGRSASSSDVAAVESPRLRDLYRDGGWRTRRAVVRAARKRPDLQLDDLVASGADRSSVDCPATGVRGDQRELEDLSSVSRELTVAGESSLRARDLSVRPVRRIGEMPAAPNRSWRVRALLDLSSIQKVEVSTS
jgi:hypothetical protein